MTSLVIKFGVVLVSNDDNGSVAAMFENIRMHVPGNSGCACVVMHSDYGNDARKMFIETGKRCGFADVQIIDWNTALYLQSILQLKKPPKNGEIIWIFNGKHFVWKIIDGCANLISEVDGDHTTRKGLTKIKGLAKHSSDPSAIFIPNRRECEDLIKSVFPNCNVFTLAIGKNTAEGAVIKARIMHGDSEVFGYDAACALPWKVTAYLDNNEFFSVDLNETLPLKKALDMSTSGRNSLQFSQLEVRRLLFR